MKKNRFISLSRLVWFSLIIGCAANLFAAPGDLDVTFGNGGKVRTPISPISYSGIKSVAVQPDGKIVTTGDALNFFLVRYSGDGSLDNSFGTNGKLSTPFSVNGDSYSNALTVQPDGKILVIGTARVNNKWSFAIARYNSNGNFDNSFGNQGRVSLAVSSNPEISDILYCIALQTDGKIVVAGRAAGSITVARFNDNGSIDASFAANGIYRTPLTSFGAQQFPTNQLVIQTDGKILVGGLSTPDVANGGVVLRLNANGSLDTNFGSNGILKTEPNIQFLSHFFHLESIALQTDDKIILAGIVLRHQSRPYPFALRTYFNGEIVLLRYNQNGTLDTTFGNNGITALYSRKSSEQINAVFVQPDNKIIACGLIHSIINSRYIHPNLHNANFLITRFNANGELDLSWGKNGFVETDFGNSLNESATDIAMQPDGKIIVAGNNYQNGAATDFVTARYLNQ